MNRIIFIYQNFSALYLREGKKILIKKLDKILYIPVKSPIFSFVFCI